MSFLKQFRQLFSTKKKDERALFDELKKQFTRDHDLVFVGELLQLAYKKYPDQIALICRDKSITYKEFYLRSLLLSKKFASQGIGLRDHVILYSENSIEFYIAYFAIWQCGAIVAPINIFLHEKELAHILDDAHPKAIFTQKIHQEKLENLINQGLIKQLPTLFTEQDIDWLTLVPKSIEDAYPDFTIAILTSDELCLLLYTSGTTGSPKGVMLSSRNIMTNTLQGHARFLISGQNAQERFLCVLPLFHVFAQNSCLWLPIMTGSTIIVVSKIDRKLILEGLENKPTLFFGFPALYGLLCLMKTAPLDSIKLFVSGADMLPDRIRSAFAMVYGRKICSGYGLTEASPVVAIHYHNEEQATNVVGFPMADLECQVRDDEGKILKTGQIGTLWIRGDNVMLGYYKVPDATTRVLQNGWLNTGDLVSIDKAGMITITGRSKDLIIHKGFNIYPQEIENVLLKHPAVFKAAVVGRDEVLSGQIPVAYVAVRSGHKNVEEGLRELCAHNLAAYKIPRKFICLEDLPMNATGKVDKKQLNSGT